MFLSVDSTVSSPPYWVIETAIINPPAKIHFVVFYDFGDESVSLLAHLSEIKKAAAVNPIYPDYNEDTKPHSFKHPSEEEFSKILDMYNIRWEYEPRTFPIEWDAEGNIKKAFSPDFYLPDFDTYIEITTMEQKYVTEKNKKVRLLKELYPGTNINIVFKNDFYTLLKRFGLRQGAEG